ncbi:ornithine cyclodeaminase family protein [Solirubrobacter soli]|uniref:ornithine cyclodeaminase family protein n=1 Tax=Solirubrobacter soli TaxID=363832 RepID=UPI00040C1D07|nr:ornithine cyclodeaminase family protein [Solirubrobacter soli]
MLILSRAEVESLLEPDALLAAVSGGLQAVSVDAFSSAPRQSVAAYGGPFLTMAGRQVDKPVVVKLVGVFPGNVALGLDPHPATIAMIDPGTGRCLAVMDGEHITALRTAAASALSTRALAREDASVLAVVGSGVQARAHLRMLPLVRAFTSVRLVARDPGAAARLGVERGSIAGADVICLTTSSPTPVVRAAEVLPGTHVTSVGYAPPGGELDPALARAARLFVESRVAFAPPPAGCAELVGLDASAGTDLGAVLSGRAPGRTSDSEITVYKAMGHIAEDAAAAELVYRTALETGTGTRVDL